MLKDKKIRTQFQENVIAKSPLVDVGITNLWGNFMDVMKCIGRRVGDKWWWKEEVEEAISMKKETHMCGISSEEKMNKYESMTNKSQKAVSEAMREKADVGIT